MDARLSGVDIAIILSLIRIALPSFCSALRRGITSQVGAGRLLVQALRLSVGGARSCAVGYEDEYVGR
jgi:hypothetical protein